MICGSCGAVGPSLPRLKSGLIRCAPCYVALQESNRDVLEDEAGVCVWPRVAIELPVPSVMTALPAPTSQDTVTPAELSQRAQARARWMEQRKFRPSEPVDVKARQAVES